jgi:hypothetical protein
VKLNPVKPSEVAVGILPIAAACLAFFAVRGVVAHDAVAADAAADVGGRRAPVANTPRAAGRRASVELTAAREEIRLAEARREAIRAAWREHGPGASRREVLASTFGNDRLERALWLVASESGSPSERAEASATLRERPHVSLAAIENAMARLPDPSLGTGPAHELLLRLASNGIGLDPAARLDLLTRELNGRADDPGARPYRPAAALDLLISSASQPQVESLLLGALQKHRDAETREELVLRFAAAYPERALELGRTGALAAL